MARPEPYPGIKEFKMPIKGKFYSTQELEQILGISRQGVWNIAARHGWISLVAGIYCAEQVEPYLEGRNIYPETLPIRDFDYPEGADWNQRSDDYNKALEAMQAEDDDESFQAGPVISQ